MEKIDLFSNSDLINKLYKKYYVDDTIDRTTSSYWRKYGAKYSVKIDDAKNIILDEGGCGELGNTKTNNIVTKLFNYFCILFHFIKIKNKKDISLMLDISIKICRKMGFYFSLDCFRQICSLALVIKKMDESLKNKRIIFLMIGDGFGFLSAVIKLACTPKFGHGLPYKTAMS